MATIIDSKTFSETQEQLCKLSSIFLEMWENIVDTQKKGVLNTWIKNAEKIFSFIPKEEIPFEKVKILVEENFRVQILACENSEKLSEFISKEGISLNTVKTVVEIMAETNVYHNSVSEAVEKLLKFISDEKIPFNNVKKIVALNYEAQKLAIRLLNKETFQNAITELTEPKLISFILATQLSNTIQLNDANKVLSPEQLAKVYNDLYALALKNWKQFDYKNNQEIAKDFSQYVQEHFPDLSAHEDLQYENFANREIMDAFNYVKNIVIPLLGKRNIFSALIENSFPRMGALFLEYIEKFFENAPMTYKPSYLCELHNEVLRLGLLLRETEYPGFEFAASFSLANILGLPKNELLAHYLIHRIIDHVFSNNNIDFKNFEEVITEMQQKFLHILEELKNCENKKQLQNKLQALKSTFNFNEQQLSDWMMGVDRVTRVYDKYQPELGKRDEDSPIARLLIVGDSVTAGVGLPDSQHEKRCIPLMMKILKLKDKKINSEIINASTMGYTTKDVLSVIEQLLTDKDGPSVIEQLLTDYVPDVVLCTLGGNDIYSRAWSQQLQDEIEENMVDFVEICKNKGIRHVGWGLEIPETFPHFEKWRAAFSEIATNVSNRTKVPVFIVPGGMLQKEHIGLDGIHPNELGHRIIAESFASKIKGTLQNEWTEIPLTSETLRAKERGARGDTKQIAEQTSRVSSSSSMGLGLTTGLQASLSSIPEASRSSASNGIINRPGFTPGYSVFGSTGSNTLDLNSGKSQSSKNLK